MTKSIKVQARELQHNLAAVLRGTAFAIRIHKTPELNAYAIYATLYRENLREDGTPLCTLSDLSVDNIPYILSQLSEATGRRINFNVYVTAKPKKRKIYFIEVPNASGLRRMRSDLAIAIHESAIRDDAVTIAYSRRTSEVSFCDYTEYYCYETLEA